jgi:choline kinase
VLTRPTGLVLAAGAGRRLRPHTDELPKTLVPLGAGRTVLGSTLRNFAEVGIEEAVIIVGCLADAIERRVPQLEEDTGLAITLVHNDHAEDRNNAYSLWCARELLQRTDVLLANGDTLHPHSVQRALLDAPTGRLTLAVDRHKQLGSEEMKVRVDPGGCLESISKGLPFDADGEYIGVALLPASRGAVLVDALERTWTADEQRYYEDAFQLLADEGERIATVGIGAVDWIEIDDLVDLARAEVLACQS